MNEQFISDNFYDAEVSKLLREVGFSDYCIFRYRIDNNDLIEVPMKNSDHDMGYVATPLYQQAIEWLFEARRVSVSINSHRSDLINDFYSFVIHNQCLDMNHPNRCKISGNSFNTQGEAYKAGILEAISILKQQNT